MGKYDPIGVFLRRQKRPTVDLTFRDIERLVGGILPKASLVSGWWTEGEGSPQTLAWTRAGYAAEPDLAAERVRFVRPAGSDHVKA
jgi:hypothetical protein